MTSTKQQDLDYSKPSLGTWAISRHPREGGIQCLSLAVDHTRAVTLGGYVTGARESGHRGNADTGTDRNELAGISRKPQPNNTSPFAIIIDEMPDRVGDASHPDHGRP